MNSNVFEIYRFLITVSDMAFSSLRNLFLEAWKLAQINHI